MGGSQILPSLVKLGFHLGNALLEVRLGLLHGRHPGVYLLLASPVESLELVEVGTHGLKELVCLGGAAADARFVNNLEPDGGEDFLDKNLSLDWCPGACLPWNVDEEVVAILQVPARSRG